jgi:hypothetical protein
MPSVALFELIISGDVTHVFLWQLSEGVQSGSTAIDWQTGINAIAMHYISLIVDHLTSSRQVQTLGET